MSTCLPRYNFHILDESGWNFRHALYHEEHRRTLIKAYGIKFLITVNGKGGKFDATRTIVIIVTGLGLMGLANIMCDLVLLKSSNRYRQQIAEKKFEQIDTSKFSPDTRTAVTGEEQRLDHTFLADGLRRYSSIWQSKISNHSMKSTNSSKVVTATISQNPLTSSNPDVTQTIPQLRIIQPQIDCLESDL